MSGLVPRPADPRLTTLRAQVYQVLEKPRDSACAAAPIVIGGVFASGAVLIARGGPAAAIEVFITKRRLSLPLLGPADSRAMSELRNIPLDNALVVGSA